ncbi:glutathione S-transferase [Pyrenochaeta sp. MPI-SDFR-AT-0127]|nr:glutathione S-transferase [Pyrenochaeta sp. MPI-SDFR-AT-0127]
MTITVYGATYSTRTQRVLLVLEKLGLVFEIKDIDLAKGEHRSHDFIAAHHPFGKVPAIEDDGVKIFESRAIARYLVNKYPGPLSLPRDSATLADFEVAASVDYAYFEPAVSKLGWEKLFKKFITGQEADTGVVSQLEGELRDVLDYYENVLAQRTWLAGQEFSLVDVFHIPWFNFLYTKLGYEEEIQSRPRLAAWWAKASQDSAWKKILGEQHRNS